MIGPYRIEAYVIASMDGMIADATGIMPASLHLEADQRYFEDGARRRRSRGAWPPFPGDPSQLAQRRRLILTRAIVGLAPDPANPFAKLWNPFDVSLEDALAAIGASSGRVAIAGGPQVYSLFLKFGYDAFHLCRAVRVRIPDGLPVFSRDRFGGEPDASLAAAGLNPGPTQMLDPEVSLTDWTKTG